MRLGASLVVGLSACALTTDLNGFVGGSSPVEDGGVTITPEAGSDGEPPRETIPDAGLAPFVDPPCTPVVIDSPFMSAFDRDQWVAASHNVPDYPREGTFAGDQAAILIPETAAGPHDAWSGVWLRRSVPLQSFELTLEAKVRCPTEDSCGDGFSVSWLEATSGDDVASHGGGGASLGVAAGSGLGFAIDLHYNEGFGETTVPSLQIVDLDRIDRQPWVLAERGRASVLDAWHRIRVTSAAGEVTVDFDDVPGIVAHRGPILTRGVIGFGAGTGFSTLAAAFRNVRGRFFDCVRP